MAAFRHIDLFSGIGGFALAASWVWPEHEVVTFVEIDSYCQRVLRKHWPNAPIHSDIRTFDGTRYTGTVDLITGGFPCQPFSVAGKRQGATDDRALWPEMLRVIREVRPCWVVGENVAGIINMELDSYLSDLEGEGYTTGTLVIPACAVDARHRRDRVWVVANTDLAECETWGGNGLGDRESTESPTRYRGAMADASRSGRKERNASAFTDRPGHVAGCDTQGAPNVADAQGGVGCDVRGNGALANASRDRTGNRTWEPEPAVGRVAHGVSDRTHRLKSLGNAIVPQVAAEIFHAIKAIDA